MSSESYMGSTKSLSVVARRSALGVQMCSVIHVWDRSHNSHTQACCNIHMTGLKYVAMTTTLPLLPKVTSQRLCLCSAFAGGVDSAPTLVLSALAVVEVK
jgi:hypothetical protein